MTVRKSGEGDLAVTHQNKFLNFGNAHAADDIFGKKTENALKLFQT